MIPKIIHQVAPKDENDWNPIWKLCHESWKKHFPESEYKHILWNDAEDCDRLVEEHFSCYQDLYNSFPFHMIKLDFTRILMLIKYGGIYADMDMFCYKNFFNELDKETCIVQSFQGDDVLLMGCLIASEIDSRFLKQHIEDIKNNYYSFKDNMNKRAYICEIAGPWSISYNYDNYTNKEQIKILKNSFYNENQLSYRDHYRTKHMTTNIWGKEDVDCFKDISEKSNISLEQSFKNAMWEKKSINLDNWDFYTSYLEPNCKAFSQNPKKNIQY